MPEQERFSGIYPAVATAFDASEEIDEQAQRRLVSRLIESGVHGLFPAGTTGESSALCADEKKRVVSIVIDEARGRVPVLASAGAITTRECVALAEHAQEAGADGVSALTPYFISPSQQELFDHYAAIAKSVDIPVLAYNNPTRTGVAIEPSTAARLAERLDNFVGIKDSSADLTNTLEYVRLCPASFCTFIGRDTLIYAALTNGACGAVAATANVVPRLVVAIYDAAISGRCDEGRRLQRELAPLRLAFELGTFPAIIKEALELIGIPVGPARRPIGKLCESDRRSLAGILDRVTQVERSLAPVNG